MPTLNPDEIYQILLDVGFDPNEAVTFTAIAMAESGGNTAAHNPNGEDSWGLFQVNVDPDVRDNPWGDLTDPVNNARAAFEISNGGSNISPWTVTHDSNRGTNKDYRNFLDEAREASGGEYLGDDRGVTGYGGGPSTPGTGMPGGIDWHPPDDDGGDLDVDAPSGGGVQAFLDHALAQTGDSYVFGHETDLADDNPETFDCSELVQWAAAQVGVDMPDGSWIQYNTLEQQGAAMSVEEALRTPGALLFSFSSDPSAGGRPSSAHVAISLGDGTTIEARGTRYGVGTWDAGDRFNYAAAIPDLGSVDLSGLGGTVPDADGDLLSDYDEISFGTDPAVADTDQDGLLDGFESLIGTSGTSADTDNDGLSDAYELSRTRTNPMAADTDADGVTDNLELAAGTDPTNGVPFQIDVSQAGGAFGLGAETDTDADGLSDARETELGSDATKTDTDADGLADNLEYAAGTNLLAADSDSDGLSDAFELSFGTDPNAADTDGDGLFDGAELATGSDPLLSLFDDPGSALPPAAPPPPADYDPALGADFDDGLSPLGGGVATIAPEDDLADFDDDDGPDDFDDVI